MHGLMAADKQLHEVVAWVKKQLHEVVVRGLVCKCIVGLASALPAVVAAAG
jgi:hypothetical protein